MAGYSGTPLAQKLGIKAGQRVVMIGGPSSYRKSLAPVPEAVSFSAKVDSGATFIHLFVSERKTLAVSSDPFTGANRGNRESFLGPLFPLLSPVRNPLCF